MHQNARFCYISETLMSLYLLNILPRFFIKNFSQRQQQRYCALSPKELHSFVEEYFQLTMIRCCMIFLFIKICAQWHFLLIFLSKASIYFFRCVIILGLQERASFSLLFQAFYCFLFLGFKIKCKMGWLSSTTFHFE